MDLKVTIFHSLNGLFPKKKLDCRRSERDYSIWEYTSGPDNYGIYRDYITLENNIVLDLGCGLGGKTVYYAQQGVDFIVGLDIDELHIKAARQLSLEKNAQNISLVIGDAQHLPFKGDVFNIVLMNNVFEHITNPKSKKALNEVKTILKERGRACIDFSPWSAKRAAHTAEYFRIPWCHLLFSDRTLLKALGEMNPKARFGKLSYEEHFRELNKMAIDDFREMIEELNLRVIHFAVKSVEKKDFLIKLPFVGKYFVDIIVCVLEK